MQRYLNLSPTKYKFKIFFYSVPILTCQQQATNIITVLFISKGSKFQSSMNTTQSLKISTLHLLLPPSFPFSSSSVYFPFPKQFPHCNFQFAIRTIFFFFPSIYVCNNTSRVKAGIPLFHFLNYFFHFLSLSIHSPVPVEIYILAEIDRNCRNDPKLSGIGLEMEQVVLAF